MKAIKFSPTIQRLLAKVADGKLHFVTQYSAEHRAALTLACSGCGNLLTVFPAVSRPGLPDARPVQLTACVK